MVAMVCATAEQMTVASLNPCETRCNHPNVTFVSDGDTGSHSTTGAYLTALSSGNCHAKYRGTDYYWQDRVHAPFCIN